MCKLKFSVHISEAMGMAKLNTFHWHITDSHSFSFISKSNPSLSKLGAITPYKVAFYIYHTINYNRLIMKLLNSYFQVYTEAQILDVVKYGLERGVRVMPEFDAPAHVGEGWQGTNLTVCFKV